MDARTAMLLVATATLPACADFTGYSDPAGGLPDVAVADPVFSRDVAPIFERRCAVGGCHSVLTKQAGLVLVRDSAYDALVDRPSALRPGEILVRPADALHSWLVTMIDEPQAPRGNLIRMPLGSSPLTPNQIATIRNWIDRGAQHQ